MKAKEWIEMIKEHPNWRRVDIDWEAVDEIKEIMEKAMAKKPVCFYGAEDEPLCPNCHNVLDGTEEYCEICDQRLDWSEW